MTYNGGSYIQDLTLPLGILPPDLPGPYLLVPAPAIIIFLLSFLYHLIKGDFKSDSEFLGKTMMTFCKLLVVCFVVVAIAMYVWPMVFYG